MLIIVIIISIILIKIKGVVHSIQGVLHLIWEISEREKSATLRTVSKHAGTIFITIKMNIVLYKIVCHLGNIKDIELLKHKKVISGSVWRIDSTRCSLFCQTQDQLRLFLVCGNYFLVCGNYCLFLYVFKQRWCVATFLHGTAAAPSDRPILS